jgi:hypothetical protein
MRASSKRIAWLCLLLTLWSVFALTAHHHSSSLEAARCTVCLAAHSASPITASPVSNATLVPVSVVIAEPISSQYKIIAFALTVRPPPEI